MNTRTFQWQLKTKIFFGIGEAKKIGDRVKELSGTRVLLVTDPGVMRAGMADEVKDSLQKAGIEVAVFADVVPNPTTREVEKGVDLANDHGANVLVGLGGGSALDTAKAIGLMMANPGEIKNFWGKEPPNQSLPVIAVPTTAGTASEITWVTVIKDTERKVKMGIGHPKLAPAVAVCDPLLTVSMPPAVTAATGMDALTHAIESYTNTVTDPVSEQLALESIRLIGQSLRPAVAKGDNLEARYQMLLGNLLAGMAFANTRLGVVHAITSPLGGYFDVPHGTINAILLPYVMEFNLIGNLEKYAHIAEVLGENTEGLTAYQAALQAVAAIRRLSLDIGLPAGMLEFGVEEEQLPAVCAEAMKNVNIPINPRTPTLQDLIDICLRAM
ncbi:MAG: iron-containing alcohol dehydrogenase [Syntrophomonadaceae bacterium]|nr:iron-containing alcohol dehydrogenase [Syntrophomonadaceae bacterium]